MEKLIKPILSIHDLICEVQGKSRAIASCNDCKIGMFAFPRIMRSQFLIESFFASRDKGVLPSSNRTPSFAVCFWTPKICFNIDIKSIDVI